MGYLIPRPSTALSPPDPLTTIFWFPNLETMLLRVLNPGAPESVSEEDLFSEIDDFDDLEVD